MYLLFTGTENIRKKEDTQERVLTRGMYENKTRPMLQYFNGYGKIYHTNVKHNMYEINIVMYTCLVYVHIFS